MDADTFNKIQGLHWQNVTSSNIEALAHHDGTMYVRFHGGAVYEYEGVSQATFERVATAGSVGRAFHENVKGRGNMGRRL
jgi:hypothetical protein